MIEDRYVQPLAVPLRSSASASKSHLSITPGSYPSSSPARTPFNSISMATTTSYDNADVRHSALGVHSASRKIGKPAPSSQAQQQNRKPVIIYMVSPKVIHVEAHEFMSLVQRLTGPDVAGEDRRERASTSSSSPRTAADRAGRAAQPVRVKARALNRPGPAVSVSVTATRQQQQAVPPSWAGPSPSPTTGFLFHDLSPLRGGALKGEAPMVSPWMHHASDHFLSPGGASALGSPSGFLDIFGPLSSQQQ